MCGNRVEELESRVQELEASVEGLTDELVECKVRLRELEHAVDADLGFSGGDPGQADDSTAETPAGADRTKAPAAKTDDNQEDGEADAESDSESDIIVA